MGVGIGGRGEGRMEGAERYRKLRTMDTRILSRFLRCVVNVNRAATPKSPEEAGTERVTSCLLRQR